MDRMSLIGRIVQVVRKPSEDPFQANRVVAARGPFVHGAIVRSLF